MKQRKVTAMGLRTATSSEITEHMAYYKRRGHNVVHKTKFKDGSPLPFNGILLIY